MITEKTFGSRESGAEYTELPGAYLIAIERGGVQVVRTEEGGWQLPGGALLPEESHEDCIRRICLATLGFDVTVEDYVTSAEQYDLHPIQGHLHRIATFYSGALLERIASPTDATILEHKLLSLGDLETLTSPMHRFAVEECIEMLRADAHGSDDEDL